MKYSQATMCDLSAYMGNRSISNIDSFHPTWQVNPIHYATLYNNCSNDTNIPCVINSSTVTENMYEVKEQHIDFKDNGFYPISAYEMRTKLVSRQKCLLYAGVIYAVFHTQTYKKNFKYFAN